MGYSRRKLSQLETLYGKLLKKPIADIIRLMPRNFSDAEFVLAFQKYYRYIWDDLCQEHNYYVRKNKTFRGRKPLLFPSAGTFVLSKAGHVIKKARQGRQVFLSQEDKDKLRCELERQCIEKLKKREEKVKENTILLQDVVPNYADNMIDSYFYNRKNNPADVNIRYYILKEIAKFDNKRFISFFFKVMSSERNDSCREFAFRTLQKWDMTVHLPKKRKGRKSPNEHVQPALPSNPDEQMQLLYTLQLEKEKSYNVFLSYRSTDRGKVIHVKDTLNRYGLSVYVDWMLDREGLPREKMNDNTINVLKWRILQSDCLLYLHTENCKESTFIPIELDYADEHDKPMAVLNFDGSLETDTTQCKPHVAIKEDRVFVVVDGKEIEFDKWLNIKKQEK